MRKFPLYLLLFGAAISLFVSCKDDDNNDLWDSYIQWRDKNDAWMQEQQKRTNADGSRYYEVIVPEWDPAAYALIHYFNDRSLTEGNLSPLSNSTIDARYKGYLYDGTPFDSSTLQTQYGPGIFRTRLNSVITGWTIAFETMRVGDTAEIIIPYQQAYGTTTGTDIPPFSNLRFNVRLVDIPAYEKQ